MAIRNFALALSITGAITTAALPGTAFAQSKELARSGEWSVNRFTESCMTMRVRNREYVNLGQLIGEPTGGFAIASDKLAPYVGAGKERIKLVVDGKAIPIINGEVMSAPDGAPPRIFTALSSSALWPDLVDAPFKAELRIDGKTVWSDTVSVPKEMGDLFMDCSVGATS